MLSHSTRGLRLVAAIALALLLGVGAQSHRAAHAMPCNPITFQVPAFAAPGGVTIQEGPVGARIPYSGNLGCGTLPPPGTKITLTLIPATQACTTAASEIVVGHPVLNQTLSFKGTFWWPAKANALTTWASCAYNPVNGAMLSNTLNFGPGQYTVIDVAAPSISVTSTSVAPGQTITITGQHWAPSGQTIKVVFGACYPCFSVLAHVLVATSATGTFSATLTIPASVAAGTYKIGAYTTMPTPAHFLDTRAKGALTITVS